MPKSAQNIDRIYICIPHENALLSLLYGKTLIYNLTKLYEIKCINNNKETVRNFCVVYLRVLLLGICFGKNDENVFFFWISYMKFKFKVIISQNMPTDRKPLVTIYVQLFKIYGFNLYQLNLNAAKFMVLNVFLHKLVILENYSLFS